MAFETCSSTHTGTVTKGIGYVDKKEKGVQAALDVVGGVNAVWAMAYSSARVYKQRKFHESKITEPVEWPYGWRLVGNAFYSLTGKVSKTYSGEAGSSDGILGVSVLKYMYMQDEEYPFDLGDIMIVCRGTGSKDEGVTDVNASKAIFKDPVTEDEIGKTHSGFYHHYNALFNGKTEDGQSLIEYVFEQSPGKVYVTGHSLGGATAHLGALALSLVAGNSEHWNENYTVDPPKIFCCSFAAPRVTNCHIGKNKLWHAFKNSGIAGLRVVNILDPVPNVPGNSGLTLRLGYGATGAIKGHGVGKTIGKGVLALLGGVLGALGDALMLAGAPVTGIWSHPQFAKVRFKDNGDGFGHPHSMGLYHDIISEKTFRLALDFVDRLKGSSTEDDEDGGGEELPPSTD